LKIARRRKRILLTVTTRRTASAREAALSNRARAGLLAVAVDDHRLSIVVDIPVMIATLPDHDGVVAIPMVTLPDNFTIAIPMAGSDSHADWTDTDSDSDFFCASRHCDANSGHCDGYYYKTPNHCMFLCF
jgi:hypothetical protein